MANEDTIFISYAHRDESWKDELLVQLRALRGAVPLDIWDDRRIKQGEDWHGEIRKAMARARFAVCLISGHFLASPFCMDEEIPDLLRKREEAGLELLPILIEDCPWEAHLWLKRLQMLPRDGKTVKVDYRDQHETVFSAVAKRVYQAIQASAATARPQATAGDAAAVMIDSQRLPRPQTPLLGRHDKIQVLIDALGKPGYRLIVFHGWGGGGKTALVRAWADSLAEDAGTRSRRVFAWCFSNQSGGDRETSADSFAIAALRFFGDGSPLQGQPWEKGERLAGLLAGGQGIVILDGLEPLQNREGTLKDPIVLGFLRQLLRHDAGLCVVTSRVALADFAAAGAAAVQQHNVEEITPALGRALLRSRGVEGNDRELEALVEEFGCQALAIELLASYLRLRGPSLVPPPELPVVARGDYVRRVLAGLASAFGDGAEIGLLRALALFDEPIGMGELDAVLAPPALAGATEFLETARGTLLFSLIRKLRAERLLTVSEGEPPTINMHPIVRQYFADDWSHASPAAFLAGHQRLYRHYRAQVPTEPRSVEECECLFRAIVQGCLGGLHAEAYQLYRGAAARRGLSLLSSEHSLIGLELSALAGFFETRWSAVVGALPSAARMEVLDRVAECLQALGRVAEAEAPLLQCLKQEDGGADETAASTAQSLSTVYLVLGDLPRARDYSQRSVSLSAAQPADQRTVHFLARHGDILQLMGDIDEAAATLQRAEVLNAALDPAHPQFHGLASFWMCDLILAQAQRLRVGGENGRPAPDRCIELLEEVRRRAMVAMVEDLRDPFFAALHHLCLGRASMLAALVSTRYRLSDAIEPLDEGVSGLRQAGRRHWLPRGLLPRAALRRELGLLREAERDIAEALEIAETGQITPMRLHVADCLIEQVRVALARGDKASAASLLPQVRALVNVMSYHGRDGVLAAIESSL